MSRGTGLRVCILITAVVVGWVCQLTAAQVVREQGSYTYTLDCSVKKPGTETPVAGASVKLTMFTPTGTIAETRTTDATGQCQFIVITSHNPMGKKHILTTGMNPKCAPGVTSWKCTSVTETKVVYCGCTKTIFE